MNDGNDDDSEDYGMGSRQNIVHHGSRTEPARRFAVELGKAWENKFMSKTKFFYLIFENFSAEEKILKNSKHFLFTKN